MNRAASLVLAGVSALGLRQLSLLPVGARVDDAAIRLSWSARPERVERCRMRTPEELAALPEHMRLSVECTGGFARYHLVLDVSETRLVDDTVRGGGLRHDRPIHLVRDLRVAAGRQRVLLTLARIDTVVARDTATRDSTGQLGSRAMREVQERRRREAEALPARLVLDTLLTLDPGRVLLVTYDNERRRLVAHGSVP